MARFKRGLILFQRALRLVDNRALNAALSECGEVIAAFVFDPRQTDDNPYFSPRAFRFMLDSLDELSRELQAAGGRLVRFVGDPAQVVSGLAVDRRIDAVYFNRDTTPFARQREGDLHDAGLAHGIPVFDYQDALLHAPDAVLKADGSPYTVFTPYYRRAVELDVAAAQPQAPGRYALDPLPGEGDGPGPGEFTPGGEAPGRQAGLRRLQAALGSNYAAARDDLGADGTTHLSAHLKFGTVSIREVYHALAAGLGRGGELVRQLFWRDFFSHIGYHFPHVFGQPFNRRYRHVVWDDPGERFRAWCDGRTGVPIVDAGMRELNATGFMHNRARMVTASFLVKDLHIDWREGEGYFATRLVDYDPAVNNGSWQWAASTGCDAQPYFRIFNPWRQQVRFDPDARYIKRWVPELAGLDVKAIHRLGDGVGYGAYPAPIVDHGVEAAEAKRRFGRGVGG